MKDYELTIRGELPALRREAENYGLKVKVVAKEGDNFIHYDSDPQKSKDVLIPDGHILVHAMGRTEDNGDIVDMFWDAVDERRGFGSRR